MINIRILFILNQIFEIIHTLENLLIHMIDEILLTINDFIYEHLCILLHFLYGILMTGFISSIDKISILGEIIQELGLISIQEHPFKFIYELATPEDSIHFDNIGQLYTFLGTNNVWCDTGDIEVTYPADTKLFLTARDEEITGNIAPIENGTTASKAYAQGEYFWHDTKFCKALTAIASGATFTSGTNYTETTVAAELLAAQN